MKRYIRAADTSDEYMDEDMGIQQMDQEYTSEKTSINISKVPAVFKEVKHWRPGTINIDYGGGRADTAADYLAQFDVVNLVYDPYNRTPEHNREVLRTIRKAGGADSATCSNVLNVIKEPEVRRNVLENIRRVVKPEGVVYITVYEGSGKGNEGPTKSGYQLNRKTADYLDEIKEVFPDAIRKGKLIIAHPNGSVTSSVDLPSRYWEPGVEDETNDLSDEMLLDIYSFLDDYDSEDINTMIRDVMQTYDLSRNLAKMAVWNWRMKDEDIPFTYSDSIEATLSRVGSVSRSELHQRLMDEATGILQRPDMHIGAADLSKRLRITEEEIEPDVLRIEVFCPLPQDKLQQLSSQLDHIVQEYCPAAYFDYAEPKVAEAYIVDRKINANTRVYAASSVSIKQIHDKLLNAASKRLQESDMGFPLDEIADYLIVEEEETEDGALRIEVRCELNHEGMTKLAEALDPIVARYDKNAYFDMVAPGIMEAFIFNRKITAAKFPELSLDPPEQRELTEYTNFEYLTLSLDDDVVVSDGAIDFLATPTFAAGVEEWSLNPDVPDVVVYSEDVAENVLQLIEPEIPLSDGIYHVKGDVTLAYDVLYVFQDDIPVYDDIRPRFNYAESELSKIAVESAD